MTEEQKGQIFQKASPELSLPTDGEWAVIDGEPCRVLEFIPWGCIREGKIIADKADSYASVILECKKVPETIKGYITHKIDSRNLWEVFKERAIKENEEVIICWTKQHYKYRWLKYFRSFPKLRVIIFPTGHLEFMADPNLKPESKSYEEMLTPIVDLKPEIMV